MVRTIVKATVIRHGVDDYTVHLTYKCHNGAFSDITQCDHNTQVDACYINRKVRVPFDGASYFNCNTGFYVTTFDFVYDMYVGAVGMNRVDFNSMVNFIDAFISGCHNLDIRTNLMLEFGNHSHVFRYKDKNPYFKFSEYYLTEWEAI